MCLDLTEASWVPSPGAALFGPVIRPEACSHRPEFQFGLPEAPLLLLADFAGFEVDADDLGKRLVPNDLIALAGYLFEPRPIDDVYLASPVSNEAGRLERPRNQRDRRSPCSEHLREEVLRESYGRDLRLEAVLGLEQPAGKSRLRIMHRVARRYLLRLNPEHLGIIRDDFLDAFALQRRARESIGRYDGEGS
jgi:hypothetical protein